MLTSLGLLKVSDTEPQRGHSKMDMHSEMYLHAYPKVSPYVEIPRVHGAITQLVGPIWWETLEQLREPMRRRFQSQLDSLLVSI